MYYLQVTPLLICCDGISCEAVKASVKSILPRLTQLEMLHLNCIKLAVSILQFALTYMYYMGTCNIFEPVIQSRMTFSDCLM